MDIRLRRTWFAPDISGDTSGKYVARNGRVVARGHRLRKGVHLNLPDAWRTRLPSDAQVLNALEDYKLEEDEVQHAPAGDDDKPDELYAADLQLAQAAHAQRVEDEAEADRKVAVKQQRLANLVKAREAKKEKKNDA